MSAMPCHATWNFWSRCSVRKGRLFSVVGSLLGLIQQPLKGASHPPPLSWQGSEMPWVNSENIPQCFWASVSLPVNLAYLNLSPRSPYRDCRAIASSFCVKRLSPFKTQNCTLNCAHSLIPQQKQAYRISSNLRAFGDCEGTWDGGLRKHLQTDFLLFHTAPKC